MPFVVPSLPKASTARRSVKREVGSLSNHEPEVVKPLW